MLFFSFLSQFNHLKHKGSTDKNLFIVYSLGCCCNLFQQIFIASLSHFLALCPIVLVDQIALLICYFNFMFLYVTIFIYFVLIFISIVFFLLYAEEIRFHIHVLPDWLLRMLWKAKKFKIWSVLFGTQTDRIPPPV